MKNSFILSSSIDTSQLSFWQSPIWADILTASKQVREAFYYGNIHSSFILIEIRSIGLGFFGAFAIGVSHTQIGDDWQDYLSTLKIILSDKKVLFLQIEPIDEIKIKNKEHLNQEFSKKFLTPYTRIIDLSQTEDEIWGKMHEKGRYNIRTAIKRGVHIESVVPTQENIDIWMQLFTDTLSRDGFSGNSREYYEIFLRTLDQQKSGGLYFARFEDRVIAAGIFVFNSDRAIYYYGASSSQYCDRKVFGSYLLQWEVMRIAKSLGISVYDFLGISSPDSIDDPLAGVSFFKSRFGGKVIALPQKIIFPLSWKYSIFKILYRIKRFLKF